jgi:hypothetical protein
MPPWKLKNLGMAACCMWLAYSTAMRIPFGTVSRMWANFRQMRPLAASEQKGGRKKASIDQPGLVEAVAASVADHTAGSPVDESQLWTNRSPRDIAAEVTSEGFDIGPDTVRTILTENLGLSLRQAVKDEATCHFAQRDEQFKHIGRLRNTFRRAGCPVLSIDTKQKELLGNFFRKGRAYTNGRARVLDHDFASHGHGRMVPYGVYDVVRNEGLMLLSVGPDTSRLACDAIWRWWQRLGKWHYLGARRLLLLCDCGGSNGYRQLLFKEELSVLAQDLGLSIRVAHYPPGCSKYNPIEHRMFSHVTRALRGVTLRSVGVARRLIPRATTASGLRIVAEIARRVYEKGLHASEAFIQEMPIRFHHHLPELNYTLPP